ncbi:unnamed protein product [Lactuca virosa]|uniref:Acid phosphatase 1 n=1 Tax=Lactuca virosa TaxID=75947 RepID=A0AAU9PRK3_9ASTR|nr:unnamed protein product [Lactuca virosa]
MAKCSVLFVATMCLASLLVASADWNILNQKTKSGLKISLRNYCESWRINVELNNIREFSVVPSECTDYIGKYMSGAQFKADSEATIEECTLYLNTHCEIKKDGKDAWIFDIDDTLLSTVPFYKKHGNGGEKLNATDLEGWMAQGKATAIDYSWNFFNDIKRRGMQIILISSRKEYLRDATIDNLVDAGFHGWKSLYLRGAEDECKKVEEFKGGVRKELVKNGYRIWGILGDQWSSIKGVETGRRPFKLPNSLYYVS